MMVFCLSKRFKMLKRELSICASWLSLHWLTKKPQVAIWSQTTQRFISSQSADQNQTVLRWWCLYNHGVQEASYEEQARKHHSSVACSCFCLPTPALGSCCDFPQRWSDLRNLFLPKLLMVMVLNHSHRNAKTGGHPGIQKLRQNMKEVLTNPHRQCQVIKNSTQGDLELEWMQLLHLV